MTGYPPMRFRRIRRMFGGLFAPQIRPFARAFVPKAHTARGAGAHGCDSLPEDAGGLFPLGESLPVNAGGLFPLDESLPVNAGGLFPLGGTLPVNAGGLFLYTTHKKGYV